MLYVAKNRTRTYFAQYTDRFLAHSCFRPPVRGDWGGRERLKRSIGISSENELSRIKLLALSKPLKFLANAVGEWLKFSFIKMKMRKGKKWPSEGKIFISQFSFMGILCGYLFSLPFACLLSIFSPLFMLALNWRVANVETTKLLVILFYVIKTR